MPEKRCIHDFLDGQCGSCAPAPFGINEIVYTTKGGQVFHNWPDCAFLRDGQALADKRGQENHPITPIKWSEVYYAEGACEWCCALHHSRELILRSCMVLIEGVWVDASHIKERFTNFNKREHQVFREATGLIHFVTNDEIRF